MAKLTREQLNEITKNQLNSEELFVLRMRRSMSLAQIGEELGVSKQWVFEVEIKARKKIEAQNALRT